MRLDQVVRGQVAELFGRFRTATALSPEERQAIAGERKEYADSLTAQLQEIEGSSTERVVEELRRVMALLRNDPALVRLPTVADLVAKVRSAAMGGGQRPLCPVCERFGAPHHVANPAQPDRLDPLRGQVYLEQSNEWWCAVHSSVYAWFLHRQRKFVEGVGFDYAPPPEILPKGTPRDLPRNEYLEYTDGALVLPYVTYLHERVESCSGRAVLTSPRGR